MIEDLMNEKEQLTLVDEDGVEVLYRILFRVESPSPEYPKNYILIVKEDQLNQENYEVEAYAYKEEGEEVILEPIDSEKEWDMLEEVLNAFEEDEEIN